VVDYEVFKEAEGGCMEAIISIIYYMAKSIVERSEYTGIDLAFTDMC